MSADQLSKANLIFLLRGRFLSDIEEMGQGLGLALIAFFEVPTRKSFRFRALIHDLGLNRQVRLLKDVCGDGATEEVRDLLLRLDDLRIYRNYVAHSQLDLASHAAATLGLSGSEGRDDGRDSETDSEPELFFVFRRRNGRAGRRLASEREIIDKLEEASIAISDLWLLADSIAQSPVRELDNSYFSARKTTPPIDDRGVTTVSSQLLDMIMPIGPLPPDYTGSLQEDFDLDYY